MEAFRFLKFPVYKQSKLFYKRCIAIVQTFPREYWSLSDQLKRASLSICLNIAEGSAKYSDKDFHRYLENALGSLNESIACLDVAHDMNLIDDQIFGEMLDEAMDITKQLGGLSKKLRSTR